MRGAKNSSEIELAKRQLIEAILITHNHKENPVARETQIVIVTRTFRMLELIWKRLGSEEVWVSIRSKRTHSPKN